MIVIPFVPGTFASTIEYAIRNFTVEYEQDRIFSEILPDGSMHGFNKMLHTLDGVLLQTDLNKSRGTNKILTPIYPLTDMHAIPALELISKSVSEVDVLIFPYIHDIEHSEINMLFQYHKITMGLRPGLGDFCGENQHNIVDWNRNYNHWTDMQPWELREWLSIFYVGWVQEWMSVVNFITTGLKISTYDLLNSPEQSFRKIIEYCKLTVSGDIKSFATSWRAKQQYVLDEYNLINDIIDAVIESRNLSWTKLNIIAESIIQQKLRSRGFEIRCWELNEFPTDAKTLGSLLEKT